MSGAVAIEDQIAAARREVKMRERVYPRWVAAAKMSQAKADAELAAMIAIVVTLERWAWLYSRPLDTLARGGVFAGRTPDNVVLNGVDLEAAIDAAREPPPALF